MDEEKSDPGIALDLRDSVLTVSLDRPDVHNAMTPAKRFGMVSA